MTTPSIRILMLLMLFAPATAAAQAPTQDPPATPAAKPVDQAQTQPAAEQRPTGLPTRITWTFNFDAGWGTFGFGNSLFRNPKDPVEIDLSDQWFEGYVKPALSGAFTFESAGEIYGKVSAVGERTYGASPRFIGPDISSFGPDDLYIGWRSGNAFEKLGENALDFSVGRVPYQLGHGMLLYDGTAEGGSRGGYWTNARKAFEFAAIGRFKPGSHLVEAFYLDRDELDEADSGTRLWGLNYEFSHGEQTTLGATYMKFDAKGRIAPQRDGLNIFNIRAYTAPLSSLPDLSFEFEYASERNGDALDSNAWTLQGGYELSSVPWTPALSYRYAKFQGDDPDTVKNEAFDPLFPGFYDWGYWWQGEIAGEYFLQNSNLASHMIRAHLTPSESIGTGVIFWDFRIDHPATYGPDVTDDHAAFETDVYVDWKVNSNVTINLLVAVASPGKAVEQATGRTKRFRYGMVYVAYSF